MSSTHPVRTFLGLVVGLLLVTGPAGLVAGQDITDDMVGQDPTAWSTWEDAARALEHEDMSGAATALDKVLGLNLSDLRLALMADRTGTIRLEAWAANDDAPDGVKAVTQKIEAGRRQKTLAEDGWHFAQIGRFRWADAQFKALVESNPDSVALLELARQNPNRHLTLIKLLNNTDVGPSAAQFLKVLEQGEELLRTNAYEITVNIAKLLGTPREVHNASMRLRDSGEYAIPQLIQALQNPSEPGLTPAVIQVLPQIGRSALNPMCIALNMEDDITRGVLIDAAGSIGYKQVLPYLAKVAANDKASAQVRSAASQAMVALGHGGNADVAGMFYQLGEQYYDGIDSLRADPTVDMANVWYLRDGGLRYIKVPRNVFVDIMAMRCCEEALIANPSHTAATALWLAANFRREAKLALGVESDKPNPLAVKDGTKPDHYPRAIYFARAAGPMYNHMVLARAVKDRDPGVALGAIAALAATAGGKSLVGAEDVKQPLVQTLSFPNRQVRIKAALALARAMPETPFAGAQNVVPVLNEALAQSGRRAALVIDPDNNLRNKFQTLLRILGYECGVGSNVHQAREHGSKASLTAYDLILVASDVGEPDLLTTINDLRRQFETAATPILIVAKSDGVTKASRIARGAAGVEVLLSEVIDMGDSAQIQKQMAERLGRASQALGMNPLDVDLSLSLALEAAEVLRDIAESHLKVYDFSRAVPALVTTMESRSEVLRIACAHALALSASAPAQSAIAEAAMNADRGSDERVAMFGSLAESARRNGNLLGGDLVGKLIDFTLNEQDLILQGAASKALGALDLPSNKASEIIRSQHRG